MLLSSGRTQNKSKRDHVRVGRCERTLGGHSDVLRMVFSEVALEGFSVHLDSVACILAKVPGRLVKL